MSDNLLDTALSLASMGYAIFPAMPGSKMPAVPWRLVSTCDPRWIQDWWGSFPHDNICIDCAKSQLLVIDLDHAGALSEFERIWASAPGENPPLRDVQVLIGTRRGWHLYFDDPWSTQINTASRLGRGIDTRAEGGMVLAPGSVIAGEKYSLLAGDLDHLPRAPQWLAAMCMRQARPSASRRTVPVPDWYGQILIEDWAARVIHAPDGMQNTTINQAAFALASSGLDPGIIERELLMAAELGNHPRSRAEATIRSGIAAAQRESNGNDRPQG